MYWSPGVVSNPTIAGQQRRLLPGSDLSPTWYCEAVNPTKETANLLIDSLVGAAITFAPPERYKEMDHTYKDLQAEYASQGLKTYRIPVGASDEVGLWGYINCASELKQDFESAGISPDAIVSATGSGGTLAGLIIGMPCTN